MVPPDGLLIVFSPVSKSSIFWMAGLYCKWLIRGQPGSKVTMTFHDLDVPPNDPQCISDGLVLYDGDTTLAPMHGKSGNFETNL